jgi:hypothetical protein
MSSQPAWRTRLPSEESAAATRPRRGEMVAARISGQRGLQTVPRLDRRDDLAAAQALLSRNLGGQEETKRKHLKWRELWEEAMVEMMVPHDRWYVLDLDAFSSFSAWALASLDMQDLDVFTAMLNKEHRRRFRNGAAPWRYQEDILEVKKSYEASVAERRKAQAEALVRAGLPPVVKRKRVTFPDDYLGRVIGHAESLIGSCFQAFCELAPPRVREHLALLAWILLLVIFGVRISTLGAMKFDSDVYVADGKLCLMLRHIKWWVGDRQGNRRLPFPREGRYGVPFAENGSSWRDRAVWIIMAAKQAGCLLVGTEKGWQGASGLFNGRLRTFGWLTDNAATKSTSHSGRKTCIAAGSALGATPAVLREWMLVLHDKTVDTYAKSEANFSPGLVTRDLVGFLVNMV